MSVQRFRSELGSPTDHISSIKTNTQACEGLMHACSAALHTMRNRSVSGTERPTSGQRSRSYATAKTPVGMPGLTRVGR
eukprot:15479113-Alexandrium_andersonii.AAC.1